MNAPHVLAPWQTAWPAGLALLVLLVAGWRARRHLGRVGWLPAVGFLLVGLGVRLWVVPALGQHVYDGHEAEYWDLFTGARVPNRGGTVLYPAMQWLWWGLGRVLPHWPWVPVVLMAVVGVGAAGLLGMATARLADRRVGWVVATLALVHPAQAAWSSSAYNVILPLFFGALLLAVTASLWRQRRPSASLAWVGAASFALVVATRMDAATVALPAALLLVPLLSRRALWLPALGGLGLAGLAAWPLVFPGQLPGGGEHGLAFAINLGILDYYHPYDRVGIVLLVGGLVAARRWPWPTLALVAGALANHLALASFDDFGERHALVGLPGVLWAVGAGAVALWDGGGWRRALGVGLLGVALGASGWDLADLRHRYYGDEERFMADLDAPPFGALPRVDLAGARPPGCGWVNEDPRVQADPVASHFNLLDPAEAQALRGPDGCLRWCSDLQDWRWSSRAVRDRAIRLDHLFQLGPRAVLRRGGYACVVWQVGPRLRTPRFDGSHSRIP